MAGTSKTDSHPFDLRRKRLVEELDGRSLLVSNLCNVRYLTGFTGSNAFLLIDDAATLLLTDGRYVEQVAAECPDVETRIRPVDSTMLALIADSLHDCNVKACCVESDSMSRALWRDLVAAADGQTEFSDSSGVVEGLRAVKDDHELSLIRCSVAINEAALQSTLENYSSSWSELEFSWYLESEIWRRGGDGFSFDAIVAAGLSSALPHYRPGNVPIAGHSLLLIDWGTAYRGYASDLTRVVALGQPSEEVREVHKVVSDAKQAAMDVVRDGAELKAVDTAARKWIADAGYGDYFNHGLGHGFGLEIHENPFMSPAFEGHLKAGMVITIEPGIYLPGVGGVRLEDDILVTADGYERLNQLQDDFLTL